MSARLPSPIEIIAHLDRIIEGQERAKRDLACAVYWHYLGLAARDLDGRWPRDYGRQHLLMLGPTGSGKSFMVRTLAEWMGVPCVFVSATSLVETGYVGDDVDTPFRLLLAKAGGDARLAASGLVVLDEVDKIRRAPGATRDISGEGVQNGLLTILDGVTLHLAAKRHGESTPPIPLDTSRTLIIATGAFVGLDEIVRRRQAGPPAMGFRGPSDRAGNGAPDLAMLDQVTADDLVAFGMIPEFIGRFGTITATRALDRFALAAILTQREDSVLSRCRAMFALHGIELEFTAGAIEAIAERALHSGTGARGLNGQLRRSLEQVTWQLPDMAGHTCRVIIGREVIEHGAPPRKVTTRDGRRCMADVLRRQSIARRKVEARAPAGAETPAEAAVPVIDTTAPARRSPPAGTLSPGPGKCRAEQTTFPLSHPDPIAQVRKQVGYDRATALARWRWSRYEGRWWADAAFRGLCATMAHAKLGVQDLSASLGLYLEEPPDEVTEVVKVIQHVRSDDGNRVADWVLAGDVDDPTAGHVPPLPPAAH